MKETVFSKDELEAMAGAMLKAGGLRDEDAAQIARDLVTADMRGLFSHGVSRIPMYLKRIREKCVKPQPNITVEKISQAALRINGDDGMGFLVAHRAMEEGMKLAEQTGIAIAGCVHSTHFGMSALYVKQALAKNFVCMVYTNSSPALAPFGARTAFLGAAPFAAGLPGGYTSPGYLLDMAMTIIARGKIRVAATNHEPIALGLALDKNGAPTTDAASAFEGVCLPFGGVKGAALSMLMDMLCGMYLGNNYAGEVSSLYFKFSEPQNLGHLMFIMKPDLFIPLDAYKKRMDEYYRRLKALPRAQGVDEIMMPGEPEDRKYAAALKEGIRISGPILEDLYEAAKLYKLESMDFFKKGGAE
jgi:LDH2 family malate/lactate/ureidoglycolate dehydrogenase